MDAIKSTIAENMGGSAQKAADDKHQFSIEEVPNLSGKVAVITGGSEGIGYACSHTFLARNIQKLFILSVSKDVVDGATAAIAKEIGEDAAKKVTWLQCDLSDWPAVKESADKIASETDRIDILINNAGRGIMTHQLTDYGVDRHMALNHMGHDILTSHLLPIMKDTASKNNTVRIVNQASNAHQGAPSGLKFESLEEINKDYGPNGQYGMSKLAGILYSRWLAKTLSKEYPNILVNATHPGFVETKMSTEDIHEPYPLGGYAMSVGMSPLKKTPFEGALSALYAATKTTETGQYICPPAIPEPGSAQSQDEKLGEALMKLTRELIKEKTFKQSAAEGCPIKDA